MVVVRSPRMSEGAGIEVCKGEPGEEEEGEGL